MKKSLPQGNAEPDESWMELDVLLADQQWEGSVPTW